MGSSESFKKDSRVDIYLELAKPIYMAGEQVQGNIYLNVKAYAQYSALYIRLEGKEHCAWSEGSGKHRRHYSNTRQTYKEEFIVSSFGNSISPGMYTYPFSFVLPQSMPGSFYHSQSNYIMYPLTSYLTSFESKNDNQPFVVNLNVRERPKQVFGKLQIQKQTNGQCCGCCMDYGSTRISLACDKNIVLTGDTVQVQVQVDNSQGKQEITNLTLQLNQKHLMISTGGHSTMRHSQSYTLQNIATQKINPGSTETVNCQVQIPQNITAQTSIGSCTGIWFSLSFISEQGCCNYSPPIAELMITLHSKNPAIMDKPKITPPQNWNPMVAPLVFYTNMKPFVYQPMLQLANVAVAHQGNAVISGGNYEMQGYQPNYGGNNIPMNYLNDPYQNNQEYNQTKGPIQTDY